MSEFIKTTEAKAEEGNNARDSTVLEFQSLRGNGSCQKETDSLESLVKHLPFKKAGNSAGADSKYRRSKREAQKARDRKENIKNEPVPKEEMGICILTASLGKLENIGKGWKQV